MTFTLPLLAIAGSCLCAYARWRLTEPHRTTAPPPLFTTAVDRADGLVLLRDVHDRVERIRAANAWHHARYADSGGAPERVAGQPVPITVVADPELGHLASRRRGFPFYDYVQDGAA